MSRQQVLKVGIAVILVMLFLVGCGGSAPTAVSEAPAATSEPEQAAATPVQEQVAATPTPELPPDTPTPEPPTATPTPAIINPEPGITLTGNLKNSEGKDSGTINFVVSEDGKSITLVDVTVDYQGASVLLGFDKQIPISEGKIDTAVPDYGFLQVVSGNLNVPPPQENPDPALSREKKLTGQFTSPTEANGTIDLLSELNWGKPQIIDFGIMEWSATASASTSEQPSSDATTEADPTTEAPAQGASQPQPGVTLSGEIEASDTADSATINLKVSEDGTSITQVDVAMVNLSVECSGDSASGSIQSDGSEMSFMGPFPITEGTIDAALSNDGKLQGKFTSPTEASGTINVIRKEPDGAGGSMLCDFGTWEWSAKASTSTSESPTPTEESEAAAAGNLAEGTALVLGPLEADVSSVEEATTMPNFGSEAEAGMKFIVIKLEAEAGMKFIVIKLIVTKSPEDFDSESFVLENASGKQYSATGGVALVFKDLLLGFEVPNDEKLDGLTLSYK